MRDLKNYWLARAQESSTWRGLIMLLTSFGVCELNPSQIEALIAVGLLISGSLATITPDGKNDKG